MLKLRLLGTFEIIDDESSALLSLPSRKARLLLALIAASPEKQIPRALAATLLWDGDEDRSRHSLRQELSALKRALGTADAALIVRDGLIGLDRGRINVDLDELSAALKLDQVDALASAAKCWRGDFGLDLDARGGQIEQWLREQRAAAHHLAVAVFDRLVRRLDEANDWQEGLAFALALHALDPLREETHRLVIALEAKVAGRASAMARFETFRLLLRDELATRPEAQTLRLVDGLRDKSASVERLAETRAEDTMASGTLSPAQEAPVATGRPKKRIAIFGALALLAMTIGIGAAGLLARMRLPEPIAYVGEHDGKVSIALLPFRDESDSPPLAEALVRLHQRAVRTFTRGPLFTVADASGALANRPVAEVARTLRVRYVIQVTMAPINAQRAFLHIWDGGTGRSLWAQPLALAKVQGGEPDWDRLNRLVYWSSIFEITRHRAGQQQDAKAVDRDGPLWNARLAHLTAQFGPRQANEDALWGEAIKRTPDLVELRLAYANFLLARAGRDQSPDRAQDIDRADALLQPVRAARPRAADLMFQSAVLAKLRGDLASAKAQLEATLQVDPAHWGAAVQRAHIQAMTGGTALALAAFHRLVDPEEINLGTVDAAYLAGQVALINGVTDEALKYLALAKTANPHVARIHALTASAFHMAGRREEASLAAIEASKLDPRYTPAIMELRANPGPHGPAADFILGRDRYVAAFRQAREDAGIADPR